MRLACLPANRRTIFGIGGGSEPEFAGADIGAIRPASNDKELNSFNMIVVFTPITVGVAPHLAYYDIWNGLKG